MPRGRGFESSRPSATSCRIRIAYRQRRERHTHSDLLLDRSHSHAQPLRVSCLTLSLSPLLLRDVSSSRPPHPTAP